MDYREALDFILNYPRFAKVNTMSRMVFILNSLGNPQKKLSFVHIAGTNGKGSVSAMTARVLKTAGYKTGLFISPFIEDFRERISINGDMISQEDFARIFTVVHEISAGLETRPNAFEFICAIALAYYAEKDCDIVVLETGLGGRWDATNVIPAPVASAITSISIDHTRILGDTIEDIAKEKCGILKKGTLAVTYGGQAHEALSIIKNVCLENDIPLVLANEENVRILKETILFTDIQYKNLKIRIPFAGRHQIQNAIIAIEILFAVNQKSFTVSNTHISQGIAETRFPVRAEVMSENPLIIIDGAHNIGGITALCDTIQRLLPDHEITTVFGCLKDKNVEAVIKKVAEMSNTLFIVKPNSTRAEDIDVIEKKAKKHCNKTKSYTDLKTAILHAKNRAMVKGAVVICGSLYLAGESRTIIRNASEI